MAYAHALFRMGSKESVCRQRPPPASGTGTLSKRANRACSNSGPILGQCSFALLLRAFLAVQLIKTLGHVSMLPRLFAVGYTDVQSCFAYAFPKVRVAACHKA